jgi:hypothetical protein
MRFFILSLLAAQCTSILALPLQARERAVNLEGLNKHANAMAGAVKPNATAPAVEGNELGT